MAHPHLIAPPWRTADFGDGSTRVAWTSALDPGEIKAYTIDCSRELLATGNVIQTISIVPSSLSVLAGLRIDDQTNDDVRITLWLSINPDDRNRDGWNGDGERHTLTCTIEVTDGQRFERDVTLQIKQIGQN